MRGLSQDAKAVMLYLRERGASFFAVCRARYGQTEGRGRDGAGGNW